MPYYGAERDYPPPTRSIQPKPRKSALSPADLLRLDQWAAPLTWIFPFGYGPYLVGSAMDTRTYRDVDVRQPVSDDDPLFADPDRLRLLNVAMSVWAQQATGLPIDFQFQPMAEWRAEDGKPRNPLGNRWRTIHGDPDEGSDTDRSHRTVHAAALAEEVWAIDNQGDIG